MQELISKISDEFEDQFQGEPLLIKSPGRVNLIGEHTDYNDGFVLPAAIDKTIILAISPNNTKYGRFYSVDKDDNFQTDISGDIRRNNRQWVNYILGAVDQLKKQGNNISGFDCVFGGNIPIGAGLSSSAALENGILFGLSELFDIEITPLELALTGQKVENEFVGVQCGIMDQFVNIHGKDGYALKLDCRSLEFELYPFRRSDIMIVLCDTGIRRELAGSEYNIRRKQCEEGVNSLRKHNPGIKNLRDIDLPTLHKYRDELKPVVFRRCKYVLEENKRVHAACEDLINDNFESFGRRMFESHYGLRDMYEVSCRELDVLVDIAEGSSGVLGGRMMGGGFGGCTINLVKEEQVSTFIDETKKLYTETIGEDVDIYRAHLGGGTAILSEESSHSI